MRSRRVDMCVERAIKVLNPWIEYRRLLARVPGVSVGIVLGNRIAFRKGYGYANLAKRVPATEFTCYRIASISKTFTATAVMQFVEAGACQLDDKVEKFLPWFRSEKDPRLARITIRHLLTHMAGIERDGDTGHWANDRFPTIEQIRRRINQGAVVYDPLETFKYSNLGYAVLGQVIAALNGQPYEQYLGRQIIRRLGLTHTSPTLTAAVRRHLAVGYGRDTPPHPRGALPSPEAVAMTAATGLTSNVVDLCRYMSAQLPGNPILLTDQSKREMQRVHWLNKKTDAHYGIGCDIWKVGETQIVGHGGGYPGFITRMGMDTAEKIGVVVLTNALDTLAVTLTNGIFSTIQHFMRQGTGRQASRKRSPNFSRYEKRFVSRWGDTFVVNTGRQLVAFAPQSDRPMDDSAILEHIQGHEFRIASGSEFGYLGEKAIFRFDRKGRLVGLSWGPNPMEVSTQ